MSEDRIGERTCLVACLDCGKFFHFSDLNGKWCEECFEIGLHKDMNEHFDEFFKKEMGREKMKISETVSDTEKIKRLESALDEATHLLEIIENSTSSFKQRVEKTLAKIELILNGVMD